MRNFIQPGKTLTLIAPYNVLSGGGLLVGSIFGFATADALAGANIETITEDVFDSAKAAGAVTQGQLLYWDNTTKVLTTTAGANKLVGAAVQAAASGDATARVKLTGQVS